MPLLSSSPNWALHTQMLLASVMDYLKLLNNLVISLVMENYYIFSCAFFTAETTKYSPEPIYGVIDVHRFTGPMIVTVDRDQTFCG